MRDVAGTVVRQETLDGHSLVREPGDRPSQEGGRARCSLIFQNLRVSEPGSIIDGDVDELPTEPSSAKSSGSGDSMADCLDPGKFLDVQVKQLARTLALVPSDRLSCTPRSKFGRTRVVSREEFS